VIAAITSTPEEVLPSDILETELDELSENPLESSGSKSERKLTARAKVIARRLGINTSDIPGNARVSAADVEEYAAHKSESHRVDQQAAKLSNYSPEYQLESDQIETRRLLLIGAGNGTKIVLDVLVRDHSSGLISIGIIDDSEAKQATSLMGVPVLGKIDSALERWKSGEFDSVIITISSNNMVRSQIHKHLADSGVPFANVIDPTATVSPSATIGTGNIILGYCRVGPFVSMGHNNFISAMANIEHDTLIGNHTSFGPSVVFSGRVSVGDGVKFGTSIGCEPGVQIGEWSVIASGSIVTSNIPARSVMKAPSVGRVRPVID
jgi:sugar O-acyltransferase (sialic acid O-acetyltransferase NeuD family)